VARKPLQSDAATALNSNLSSKAFVLAGPTGTGKSSVAVEFAREFGGEIICADAYQVYRGMAVLTAQPTAAQRQAAPHHLYASVSPQEAYDAARYASHARTAEERVVSRGNLPILCGGSGLYIQAFAGLLMSAPTPDEELRLAIRSLSHGEAQQHLLEIEPDASRLIDMANPRRVTRALEIVLQTGTSLSKFYSVPKPATRLTGVYLARDRDDLRQRIAKNVDRMFSQGVLNEVRKLPPLGPTAHKAIGLHQVQLVLQNQMSETEAKEQIAVSTRRYAKRQETWFKNRSGLQRLEVSEHQSAEEIARNVWERYRSMLKG